MAEPYFDEARFPDGIDADWCAGYLSVRPMSDGRAWCLVPLLLGRLRIMIAEDIWTAGEHWCFNNQVDAVLAYNAGPDVPPTGWSRHMRPDGTYERPEYPAP